MQYRGNRSYGTSTSGYFPPAVKWLIIVNSAIFLVQWAAAAFAGLDIFRDFPLTPAEVWPGGKVWQLFTYTFLHRDVWHLVFNMLALWMFGMDLERDWGSKRFLKYYFLCGLAAGVCVLLVGLLVRPTEAKYATLGASGAIYGLLLAFGVLYADRIILMMLLVPMKAKYAVMIWGAIAFIGFWNPGSGVSHVAHLGGMLFGYVYLKSALLRRPAGGAPRVPLRQRFNDWKSLRARRKFQVYMKKQQRGRDRWVN